MDGEYIFQKKKKGDHSRGSEKKGSFKRSLWGNVYMGGGNIRG